MEDFATWLRETGPSAVAWGGLILGVIFGFTVQRSNFCSMGSLSDIHAFGDYKRFRIWMLSIAVAIAGTWLLGWADLVDISRSMYLPALLPIGGSIVGGLLFGFGMVFAGGCATRNLVRVGSGDLRSLVVLIVMGLFAYMTIGGLLGPLRVLIFTPLSIDLSVMDADTQGLGEVLAALMGTSATTLTAVVALVIVVALLVWCFSNRDFRASPGAIAAGIVFGLCITAGWMLTGLAFDEFASTPIALESLTFVRPAGDTLDWLMRYTAGPVPDFGVATTFGTIAGAFIGAMISGRFNVAGFADRSDFLRNLFGAVFMGVGGVLALGCTIGQGMTGVSTLAIGSFIALIAIIAGGFAGLRVFDRLLEAE
ncbi:MAG: YeeE/YedE family protein [Alphaproteobacteria bacterium]|nr:YeeE/YedE family protein [Alphaproteobacteria bacterium]